MEVHEHLDFLQREGELLATAATDVDPDTPAATVPDFPLRELVRHIGGIHRWATTTIREARVEASASDLYLLLWNRISAESLPVSGDPECLPIWRDAIRVRWTE